MQNIFGSGVAIGRFAIGSYEPLGDPQDQETIDVDVEAPKQPVGTGNTTTAEAKGKGKGEGSCTGKRKRGSSEGETQLYGGLTKSVDGLSNTIRACTPGLYKAIMDIQEFNKDAQVFCLNYLMLNKGIDKTFLEMDEEDKEYWMRDHLLKNNFFG